MLKIQICLQKYAFSCKLTIISVKNLLLGKDFLDFLVGFRQFVLAELDEFLGSLKLLLELIDVELIVLHLVDDGL